MLLVTKSMQGLMCIFIDSNSKYIQFRVTIGNYNYGIKICVAIFLHKFGLVVPNFRK